MMPEIVKVLKKNGIPVIKYSGFDRRTLINEKPSIFVQLMKDRLFFRIDYSDILIEKGMESNLPDDPELKSYYGKFLELNRKLFELFYNMVIIKSELWERIFKIRWKRFGEMVKAWIEDFMNGKTDYIPFYIYAPLKGFGIGKTSVNLIGEESLMLEYIKEALKIVSLNEEKLLNR